MMILSNAIALSLAQAGMGGLSSLAAGDSGMVPLVVTIVLVMAVAGISLMGSKRGHQD